MNTEAINVLNGLGYSSPAKEVHQSVDTLRVILVEIPKHGIVWNVGSRVSLMASVHRRKLDGVTNEKDGKIVEDKVLHAFLGIELRCPAAHIANSVR